MARLKSKHLKELEEISRFIEQVPIRSLEELDHYVLLEQNDDWEEVIQNPAYRYFFFRYISIFVLDQEKGDCHEGKD